MKVNRPLDWQFPNQKTKAVVLQRTHSYFVRVKPGVPQGSVLGPCLSLVNNINLPESLTLLGRLFADGAPGLSSTWTWPSYGNISTDLQNWRFGTQTFSFTKENLSGCLSWEESRYSTLNTKCRQMLTGCWQSIAGIIIHMEVSWAATLNSCLHSKS